jgi:hypothetical protein
MASTSCPSATSCTWTKSARRPWSATCWSCSAASTRRSPS